MNGKIVRFIPWNIAMGNEVTLKRNCGAGSVGEVGTNILFYQVS